MLIAVQEQNTSQVWRNPGNLYIIRQGDAGFVLSHTRLTHTAISDQVQHVTNCFWSKLQRMKDSSKDTRQRSMKHVCVDSVQDSFSPNAATRGSSPMASRKAAR